MLNVENIAPQLPRHARRVWAKRKVCEISELIVHQAYSSQPIEVLAKEYVDGNHVDAIGAPSFPYTWVITEEGKVFQCNALEDQTWSLGDSPWRGDFERRFVSVCLLGDFGDKNPIRQTTVLSQLIEQLQQDYGKPRPLGLHGHCHWGRATCPGRFLQSFIETYRDAEVAAAPRQLFKSRAEVTRFQREKGLRVTGVVDYDTLRWVLGNT